MGGNSKQRPEPSKAKQPERLSGAAWDTSDRPTSGGKRSWKASRSKEPITSSKRPYASILQGSNFYPLTPDEVADLFTPFRDQLKDSRELEREVKRLAKRYDATGKIDQSELPRFADAAKDAERAAGEAIEVLDSLFFENENYNSKFFKLVDDLYTAEGEIIDTLEEIDFIGELIRGGEHLTCQHPDDPPSKPKRQRKAKPKTAPHPQ